MNLAKWWTEQSAEKQAEIDRRAVVLDPSRDLGVPAQPPRLQQGGVGEGGKRDIARGGKRPSGTGLGAGPLSPVR